MGMVAAVSHVDQSWTNTANGRGGKGCDATETEQDP